MALTLQQMQAQFGDDPMRSAIVDMLWQSSRVMQLLYFVNQPGLSYPYSKRAALPGVSFRSLNSTFTATQGTTNPDVEVLTILGGKIRTDSIAIELKGAKARTNEIAGQMEAAGKFFDKNFFHGDPTAAGQANSFLGLRKRLGGSQLITNATNGAAVTIPKVTELLDAVEGENTGKTLFMNRTNRRNLSAAAVAGATGSGVFDQGKQLMEFQGAKIVEVFKDEAEAEILTFSESCGTSNVCSSIYCTRLGQQIDERGVQGLSGLSGNIKTSGPFDYGEFVEDIVQMVTGIGVFGGFVAARLQGCKAA